MLKNKNSGQSLNQDLCDGAKEYLKLSDFFAKEQSSQIVLLLCFCISY